MREMDGLSYAELADALGVSLPAVKSLLVRARIGLVEAVEARETACTDIRHDLADAFDRGVRASGRAQRHMRDCAGCVEYRSQLRAVRDGLHSLSPGPGPLTAALKLLGIGGAGSAGAASAGGGAAASGGVIAVAGGGTVTKVAAVVCCAALTAGGAVEVQRIVKPTPHSPSAQRAASASSPAGGPAAILRHVTAPPTTPISRRAEPAAAARRAAPRATVVAGPAVTQGRGLDSANARAANGSAHKADALTGGATAPDETTGFGDGVDGLTPRGPAAPAPDKGPGAPTQPPQPAAPGGLAAPAESPGAATISAPVQQPESTPPAAP